MLHGASPAETFFAAPLRMCKLKFQRVTAALFAKALRKEFQQPLHRLTRKVENCSEPVCCYQIPPKQVDTNSMLPASDWLTRCSVTRSSDTRLDGETPVFITTAIVASLAEVESGSTFPETCLATKVQQSSMKPTMLQGATRAKTCCAVTLHSRFS